MIFVSGCVDLMCLITFHFRIMHFILLVSRQAFDTREGELLSECNQGAANQWNMALFDQEDVSWRNRPCEGPELREGRFFV